jgi:hypothetical protein
VSANGQIKVEFTDVVVTKEHVAVDQHLIQVSRYGRPVNGLVGYLNEDFRKAIDFWIYEPSDSEQNFHLEVKGSHYELSRMADGEGQTILDSGHMNCRIVR